MDEKQKEQLIRHLMEIIVQAEAAIVQIRGVKEAKLPEIAPPKQVSPDPKWTIDIIQRVEPEWFKRQKQANEAQTYEFHRNDDGCTRGSAWSQNETDACCRHCGQVWKLGEAEACTCEPKPKANEAQDGWIAKEFWCEAHKTLTMLAPDNQPLGQQMGEGGSRCDCWQLPEEEAEPKPKKRGYEFI